jgi:hypothetical protein
LTLCPHCHRNIWIRAVDERGSHIQYVTRSNIGMNVEWIRTDAVVFRCAECDRNLTDDFGLAANMVRRR